MLRVLYKCACMQDEGSFEVPERGEAEDILDWMERLGIRLGADHRERSPDCRAAKTDYVKIPYDKDAPTLFSKPPLAS